MVLISLFRKQVEADPEVKRCADELRDAARKMREVIAQKDEEPRAASSR